MRIRQRDLSFGRGFAGQSNRKTRGLFLHLDRGTEPARGFKIGLHWLCRRLGFAGLAHALLRHRLNDIRRNALGCVFHGIAGTDFS